MKTNIKLFKIIKNNRSAILVGVGLIGGTLAAIKAVKDTPKAMEIIALKKEELQVDKLPVKTVVSSCWKVYTPSILMGVLSGCCIVYGQYYTSKELVGMTALYGATASNLQRYKDAVNTTSPEIAKAVKDKVAETAIKDACEKNKITSIEPVGEGEFWCVDSLTGQRFKSTIENIKYAEISINDRRLSHDYASLSDLMFDLGGRSSILTDSLGWRSINGKIKIERSDAITIDGIPHLYLEYIPEPREGFDSSY